MYSTYYAPIDWKKQLFQFDVLAIKPWLDRVAATTTDLDFYEVCVAYVAGLNDTHDQFSLPSDFVARLGFTADVYDGVLLIDSINRTMLPVKDYPFTTGDRFVSLDGRDVDLLLQDFAPYGAWANPKAAKRLTAARLTIRPQSVMPHAADVAGKSATVVVLRQSGATETYTIPWSVTGTPLSVGPVPSPKLAKAPHAAPRQQSAQATPDYMTDLLNAQWSGVVNAEALGLNGFGSINPIFVNALAGARFTRRLGGNAADFFYSGTFKYDELTIGYIRISEATPRLHLPRRHYPSSRRRSPSLMPVPTA